MTTKILIALLVSLVHTTTLASTKEQFSQVHNVCNEFSILIGHLTYWNLISATYSEEKGRKLESLIQKYPRWNKKLGHAYPICSELAGGAKVNSKEEAIRLFKIQQDRNNKSLSRLIELDKLIPDIRKKSYILTAEAESYDANARKIASGTKKPYRILIYLQNKMDSSHYGAIDKTSREQIVIWDPSSVATATKPGDYSISVISSGTITVNTESGFSKKVKQYEVADRGTKPYADWNKIKPEYDDAKRKYQNKMNEIRNMELGKLEHERRNLNEVRSRITRIHDLEI